MTAARDLLGVVAVSLVVSLPLSVLHVRQDKADEARAFGRGAIAGLCVALRDRWQDQAPHPADVASALTDCEPYLNEMDRRTGGRL